MLWLVGRFRSQIIAPCRKGPRRGLQEGDRTAGVPGPQRRSAAIFRRRAEPGFASRGKIAAAAPSFAALRPQSLRSAVQARSGPPSGDRQKAAMGAASPTGRHHHADRS
jgi:hypothetical protein